MDPTDLAAALARHVPIVRYDSQEPYFADSPAEWTANPGNVLRRADGTVLAAATPSGDEPPLSLDTLGPTAYALPTAATQPTTEDRIADTTAHGEDSYIPQARAMHAHPEFANRTFGHVGTDRNGRVWLAYWFFYFYNDYNLIGPFIHAGCHEGDWEMIQLRLGADGSPDLAVYAQHTHAGVRPWPAVETQGDRPVVYSARGSHASYFSAGIHWTGLWFDHADGRHPAPELTLETLPDSGGWAHWPGYWGGTVAPAHELDKLNDSSPRGPGPHGQFDDPEKLLDTAKGHVTDPRVLTSPPPPSAPQASASWDGDQLNVSYDATGTGVEPAGVVVATGPSGEPRTVHRFATTDPQGTVTVPADAGSSVQVSVVGADGTATPATPVAV